MFTSIFSLMTLIIIIIIFYDLQSIKKFLKDEVRHSGTISVKGVNSKEEAE